MSRSKTKYCGKNPGSGAREQRNRFRHHGLRLEPLEARQMLSATAPTFDALPPGLSVAQTHTLTQYIHGVPFEMIADPAPALAATAPTSQQTSTPTNGVLHPLTDIPVLHSDPNARVKLYLDFDGFGDPSSNVTTPVYDRDGDPSTFSDQELNNMFIIWSRTKEDYAPFNVDVTTEQPPELAPGVPDSVANGVALRVSIGGDGSWTGSVLGGIAGIGAFTNSAGNTVFVFSDNLGDAWAYWAGDVASHEAGHAFGLNHQSLYDANGNLVNAYNPGNGNWAPTMGNTYVPVTTWYNGTSSSPTTYQDDMAILAGSTNGFGYRADDHGDTSATADPLAFDGSVYTGSGLIGTNSDVDVWSINISAQDTYKFEVDPAAIGPNLDAVLELRDAAGSLIASANPAATQAAELFVGLSPATYYLSITKVAAYGFVGAYSINVSEPAAGITVSAADPLTTRESGSAAAFSLVLDTQPSSDVTIPIVSSNTAEGTVSTSSVVFTPANWNQPQTVTVSGVADGVRDGDVGYSILIGPADSLDTDYASDDPADLAAVNLDNSSAGFLYWTDTGNDVIKRSALDGSNPQTIVDLKALFGATTDYAPRYVAVDASAGQIYWTDSGPGRIQRANLDGSNVETLVTGLTTGLRGIAVDSAGGKMYWADFTAGKIQRANLDGSGIQDLITTNLTGTREIALDVAGGKIYFADYSEHNVRRANLDGTNVEVLWSGDATNSPGGVALDTTAGKMYWSDATANKILRANLNGSNVEQLVDTSSFNSGSSVPSLTIDAANGKMYFSHLANKSLYRANLDGSSVVAIASDGTAFPQGVSLLRPSVMVTPAAGLVTSEGGGSASFKVSLNTPPKANVTIPISSSNSAEGRAAVTSVTFTAANWNVPQTISVTGVDDSVLDGNKSYSIILGAAASADPDYAGLDPRDVAVTNRDNETKFFVVDDATTNNTFRYGSDGTTRGSSSLAAANSAPRGIAGSLAGDKYWVVDTSGNVFVYSNTGGLLGSWTAGGLPKNAKPEGIATHGADVWLVESSSDKVYRYSGAASQLSGTQTANSSFSLNTGNTNPKDIVTDGQSFWVVDDATKTDKVFKYTTSGALAGSWTIDAANKAPTGIAIDPTNVNHLWIVDSGTDKVYQYNAGTTRISGIQSAALTFALASGNGNAQGIADPPAPARSLLTSDRPMFVTFGAATLQTSREASISTITKRRVAWEQAFASYLPKRYEMRPTPASATTEFEHGSEKMGSELSACDDHAATDLALAAVFAGVC